jgi:predicted metal-dependent enzyme (double-stranded beta helix superfamily)
MITRNRPALPAELVGRPDAAARPTRHGPTNTIGAFGTVTVLTPPGDIHAVVNDSAVVATSLHVYGADLRQRGTSVRRCYRMRVR